jgi:hypothetical protein
MVFTGFVGTSHQRQKYSTEIGYMKVKIKVHKHQKFTVLSSFPFSSSTIWDRVG